MELVNIRHLWPEPAGFSVSRPNGADEWIFIHFLTPVTLCCGERQWEVAAGGVVMLDPATPNRFWSQGPLLHDWMHVKGDLGAVWKGAGLPPDEPLYPRCDSLITQSMQEMEAEFFAEETDSRSLCEALLTRMVIRIARGVTQTAPVMGAQVEKRLHALRRDMFTDPARRWTVEEMAEQTFLSVSHFHTLYRRLFGISPMRDLVACRVERAKHLLETHSVAETAALLGYAGPYHFIHQFKQLTGISPGKYHKK